LKLDDIAQRTRIPVRSLESIEADAFDRLPGIVFARNFVRLYAIDLELDADGLLARLPRVDIESAPLPNPPQRLGRQKWDPRLTAAVASVLWLVTACGAGTGAWYYYNNYGRHFLTAIAAAPAPKHDAAVSRGDPHEASTQPATGQIPSNQQGLSQSGLSQQALNQQSLPEGFDGSRPVQVILTAREATWVQVSADGQTAFVGLLHPNDKRSIAADAQVKIVTGNAGGLDISLNGKPLDPIGPSGQVRTVRLTAEGPQFVQRNPPASSPL